MGRSSFGIAQNPASPELLRAARIVAACLGFEMPDDGELPAILTDHAENLRRYGITGRLSDLLPSAPLSVAESPVPPGPVEGELPVGPEDVAAALKLKGLPIGLGSRDFAHSAARRKGGI